MFLFIFRFGSDGHATNFLCLGFCTAMAFRLPGDNFFLSRHTKLPDNLTSTFRPLSSTAVRLAIFFLLRLHFYLTFNQKKMKTQNPAKKRNLPTNQSIILSDYNTNQNKKSKKEKSKKKAVCQIIMETKHNQNKKTPSKKKKKEMLVDYGCSGDECC